jgi:hypothetical protein
MNPDKEIIRNHRQLFEFSCVPMAVEFVLKLIEHAERGYFELQEKSQNNKLGTFADFDNREINGVKFQHKFSVKGGRNFPPEKMKKLFETIDRELDEKKRYVIISVANDPAEPSQGWHNFVIYDRNKEGEYEAVSKTFQPDLNVHDDSDTWRRSDIRKKVTEMTGTDILTYDPIS